MLKVYVVDDEIMAIEYFQMILKECKTECTLSGYAVNYQKVIDDAEKLNFDVVFVDINMPGMSGIDLSKRLLEKNKNLKIVFLTAYRDFDFIKAGMNLGIDAYILKNELTAETLDYELDRIKNKIEQSRHAKQVEIYDAMRRYLLKATPVYEIGQIELSEGQSIWMLYIRSKRFFSIQKIKENLERLQQESFFHYQENCGYDIYTVIGLKDNTWCAIYRIRDNEESTKRKQIIESVTSYCVNLGLQVLLVDLGIYKNVSELPEMVEFASVADQRRLYLGEKDVIYGKDIEELPELKNRFDLQEEALFKAIRSEDRSEEHKALSEFLTEISLHANDEHFIKYAQNILFEYYRFMKQKKYISEIPLEWTRQEFSSCEQYKKWLLSKVQEFRKMRETRMRKGYSEKVERVLNFIENNYARNDLSVTIIAEELSVSEGYLRKVFKDELKITISEYLNNYRLNMAKKILSENNVKISDIYSKVGFTSSQYFSTAFKKFTGLSPKEYQKNIARHI